MAVAGKTYPFTQANVDAAPDEQGVYELLDGDTTIYYGKSTNSIRKRLQSHKSGAEGTCTKKATHYKREKTSKPGTREKELLDAFKAANGKLPRCNERSA